MNQCEKILNHMKTYGTISPLDAFERFGCLRLAARIADLKAQGIPIASSVETSKNRFGDTVRYAVYHIAVGGKKDG